MLTKTEKSYLLLTLFFLASGCGIKAWRHSRVRLGPFPDPQTALASAPHRVDAATDATDSSSHPLPDSSLADLFGSAAARDSSNPAFMGAKEPKDMKEDPKDPAGASRSHTGGGREKPGGKSAFSGKVNLNHAAAAELTQVKGVGEKTAQAIVEYRRAHGPFRDFRDLLQIKGIGEKKLEKLLPYLIL